MELKNIRAMVITSVCIALGVALPLALHTIPNAGSIFLPMHIPVLLCGLVCGWPYGLVCGLITPLLSSLSTGMPPIAILPSMIIELAVYGFVAGFLMQRIKTKEKLSALYISLLGAMLAGRLMFGILNALIFRAGVYTFELWLLAAFITALPGIILQLIILPVLVLALDKAGLSKTRG
ncbi:MAG TPA: ECF transporter S component [Clostridia bacterium]|nr:ECF transporter S component [Clostridia bacterium]